MRFTRSCVILSAVFICEVSCEGVSSSLATDQVDVKQDAVRRGTNENPSSTFDDGTRTKSETSSISADLEEMQEKIPLLVQYELDKHGLLIRMSIILSLIIILVGGATATTSFIFKCVEGVKRRKRIQAWEASRRGASTPKQYTQSQGEPETDLETNTGN